MEFGAGLDMLVQPHLLGGPGGAPVVGECLGQARVHGRLLAGAKRADLESREAARRLRRAAELDRHTCEPARLDVAVGREQGRDAGLVRQRAGVHDDPVAGRGQLEEAPGAPLGFLEHGRPHPAAVMPERDDADAEHRRERRVALDEQIAGQVAVRPGHDREVVLEVCARSRPRRHDPIQARRRDAAQRDGLLIHHRHDGLAVRPCRRAKRESVGEAGCHEPDCARGPSSRGDAGSIAGGTTGRKGATVSGYPAVDVAIGLSFVFLILSILATSIVEAVAGLLSYRAKSLEDWLAENLTTQGGHAPG